MGRKWAGADGDGAMTARKRAVFTGRRRAGSGPHGRGCDGLDVGRHKWRRGGSGPAQTATGWRGGAGVVVTRRRWGDGGGTRTITTMATTQRTTTDDNDDGDNEDDADVDGDGDDNEKNDDDE